MSITLLRLAISVPLAAWRAGRPGLVLVLADQQVPQDVVENREAALEFMGTRGVEADLRDDVVALVVAADRVRQLSPPPGSLLGTLPAAARNRRAHQPFDGCR